MTAAGSSIDVERAWRPIEEWYACRDASHLLHPGATPDLIARAEARLGVRFPDLLRALLLRHDGTRTDAWATGTLLSCSRIVAATELWRRTADHGDDVPRGSVAPDAERGVLRRAWWHGGWIAIDEDAHGNATAVDTAPGPGGVEGQIVGMNRRSGPSRAARDLIEYLEQAEEELHDLRVVDHAYLDEDDVWEGGDDDLFELVDVFDRVDDDPSRRA